MTIRPENVQDKSEIATLIAQNYMPNGAVIIEKLAELRRSAGYIPSLSLVDEVEGGIEAACYFSEIEVGAGKALYLAPFAVTINNPSYNSLQFFERMLEKAHEAGFRYVFVDGNVQDLQQFGFENAENKAFEGASSTLLVKDFGSGDVLSGRIKLPIFLGI